MTLHSILTNTLILAQDTGAAPAPAGGTPPGAQSFLPMMILMFVMMYFVLIRPQRKKQKALQEQMAGLKKDDRVITIGGLHGIVGNVKERTVILKVADNVRLEFEKSAIGTVIKKGDNVADAVVEAPAELKQ